MDFLLFPFRVIGWLIAFMLGCMGRLLSLILGAVLLIIGVALCASVIGLLPGIPLTILGAGLMFKAIF